jgi:hypothetical protein
MKVKMLTMRIKETFVPASGRTRCIFTLSVVRAMELIALLIMLIMSSCGTEPGANNSESRSQSLKSLTFTSEPAPEWTALMERTSGWFGADGIFSIPLD